MKTSTVQRCLVIYSGVLTIALSAVLLLGARKPDPNASFDQITVHRINVVEPDGTTRLVISDKAEFPGGFYMGKETAPRPDRLTAGMLFNDDEGTENGGLLFGGSKDKDGKTHSYGSLTFDKYHHDQTAAIATESDDDSQSTQYAINDDNTPWEITPESITGFAAERARIRTMPAGAERDAAKSAFVKKYPIGFVNRGLFADGPDKSVSLTLKDQQGHERLVARVAADGTPVIQFLDAKGKVLRTIGADSQ